MFTPIRLPLLDGCVYRACSRSRSAKAALFSASPLKMSPPVPCPTIFYCGRRESIEAEHYCSARLMAEFADDGPQEIARRNASRDLTAHTERISLVLLPT